MEYSAWNMIVSKIEWASYSLTTLRLASKVLISYSYSVKVDSYCYS